MHLVTLVAATFALLATLILGVPTALVEVEKYKGQVKEGSYIVKLKNSVSKSDHLNWLSNHLGSDTVTHKEWQKSILNGFAGKFSEKTLNLLRSNPDVENITEDGVFSANYVVTQTDAPWGIARLSQDAKITPPIPTLLNFTYKYDSSAGAGVDIYFIDTGIYTAHSQFGGRARWGATFGGYTSTDGNGHGTHVAGTAGGSQFGVTKAATLIAVKVLDDSGSGYVSDVISGLNFVISSASSTGRPSVTNLSFGGSPSTPLDNAIAALVSAGIHVTVAAGNSNTDAGSTSPALVLSVNTIGASTILDARASFSNYGPVVDLFAPGQDIISAWTGNPTATNSMSGTSMAAPHAAGLIAYFIGRYGNASPAAISTTLKNYALKGVLTNIPAGTANLLARNDIP